jgi:hypothetical protein
MFISTRRLAASLLTINVVDTFGNDNSALPFNEDVIAQ